MAKLEQSQLEAGGLVRMQAKVDAKVTEEVVARSYGGDALGDRVVVRLSAERLGPAEDLAMEYLGLEPRATSKPIARQTKRALGFANWALTHHSKHAKYALGLVKRIKGTARRAKSKPGHAWDEFSEMADELNKSVRHFLPAFWEEAARIYKDLGNQTYAGRSLNKALEAERVHALEVDREHRRDAVLEFTLSGCLSGKALSEYAQDLQNQFEPAEAYETLRDLVIRRTLGGMAPTANMGKDLIRLANAADLDSNEAVEAVLEEIISSPAMSRAPLQFWKSVKAHVKRIVKRSQIFAIWLLVHTDPQTRYGGDSAVWAWLDLLDNWDVLPNLWAKKLPAEPEIPGGRAGWIGGLARLEESPDKRVFDLIDKMAEVLKKEGEPVPLFQRNRWRSNQVDVDVLEAFLDLGIELSETPEDPQLVFGGWLRAEVDHPRRNSQLTSVATDPRFAPALRGSIPELIKFTGESTRRHYSYGRQLAPRRAFEDAAADHPAIYEVWWQYLDEQLARLESGGMPDAEIAISNLRSGVTAKTSERFPELAKRLKKIDLVDNLQRTYVAGVFDEYGWAALDEADDQHKLPPPRKYGRRDDYWVFPCVAYHRKTALVVVRPQSVDAPRELTLQTRQDLETLLPVGEDVLIVYRDQAREWSSFLRWANDPQGEVKCKDSMYGFQPVAAVSWLDGLFCGGRVLKAGDTKLYGTVSFFHDTQRFWRIKERAGYSYRHDEEAEDKLVEIDPETGKEVRESVPAWFEKDLPAGAKIDWGCSRLLPLPADVKDSPLGTRDGLIGWKIIKRRDGTQLGCGIDGRSICLEEFEDKQYYRSLTPTAMLQQPSGDGFWVFTDGGLVIDSKTGIAIADFHGTRASYREGQPGPMDPLFYHLVKVRHEASSKKLRKISKADTKKLLDAGAIEFEAMKDKETEGQPERSAASTAILKLLPKAPPRLVEGLARIARLCAAEKISLDKLRTLDPSAMTLKSDDGHTPAVSSRVSDGMAQSEIPRAASSYYGGSGSANCDEHLQAVAKFLAGGKPADPFQACGLSWMNILRDFPCTVWRAFWRLGSIEEQFASVADRLRQPWLDALEFFANSGILDLPGSFRLHKATAEDDKGKRVTSRKQKAIAWVQGDNRYVGQFLSSYPKDIVHILEYAPKDSYQTPKGYVIEETQDAPVLWTGKQLKEFVDAVRQVTELPMATAEQLESASTQLQVTPVEVAIVWMGNLRTVAHGNDKLTKEIRTFYKWKVKPVQEAIASLEAGAIPNLVIGTPIHKSPGAVFGDGQAEAFDALVAAWKKSQGDSVRVSPELVATLGKSSGRYHRSTTEPLLQLLNEGSKSDLFKPRKFSFDVGDKKNRYRSISIKYDPPKDDQNDRILEDLPFMIRLINYAAPAGDEARRALPGLIDAARKYLDHKSTVFPFGCSWAVADTEKFDADEILARFTQVLGKFTKKKGFYQCDDGFIVAALDPPFCQLVFRSAGLKDDESWQRLVAAASQTYGWEGSGEGNIESARVVVLMKSERMTQLAELNRDNPVEDGRWEQDPRVSAAKTVKAVQKKLKLTEESATVYLQLLALSDPTSVNLRKWNDWTPKVLKETIAPLLDGEHVVSAKRSRAGRDVFLPGGWEALKAPNLPIETWKLPLFEIKDVESVRYTLIVPQCPVAVLFAAAWERVESGDVPKYEEV